MPFHQFYHDIFLGQDPNWKNIYGIKENENKYQIQYVLKNLEEEEKGATNNDPNINYIEDINNLAHHYEDFFLNKKPRNVDYNNKKNQFIKTFMQNTLNDEYLNLLEEVKKLKNYYDTRYGQKVKFTKIDVHNQTKEDTMNNLINESTQIELNEIKTKNNSDINVFEAPINGTIKNSNTNESIINLEENNEKENNIENISENVLSKKENNTIVNIKEDDLEKNEEKILCNNKRKNDKIKYFIFYKKLKTEDNTKDILLIK
jgi:hypothetical protein